MVEKRTASKTGKGPKADKEKGDLSVARIATIAAGATIGSAAVAAAVLFATRKRDGEESTPTAKAPGKPSPARPVPETD